MRRYYKLSAAILSCLLCMTACNSEEDKSSVTVASQPIQTSEAADKADSVEEEVESLSYKQSAGVELTDYLAAQAQDSYEDEYVKLDAVADFSFVPNGKGVDLYRGGLSCGWLVMYDFGDADWMSNPDRYVNYSFSGTSGVCQLLESGEENNFCWYAYEKVELPFSYGDTEWLVTEGIFQSLEEATAEELVTYQVFWGEEGSPYAYYLTVEGYAVSESELKELVTAITFKEGAFRQENYEKEAQDVPVYEYDRSLFKSISEKYALSITYQICSGEIEYAVPEGTVAWQSSETEWELYCYNSGIPTLKQIGYIQIVHYEEAATMLNVLNDMDIQGYKGEWLSETEEGWQYIYKYSESLYSENQQKKLSQRENSKALVENQKQYVGMVLLDEQGKNALQVVMQSFE